MSAKSGGGPAVLDASTPAVILTPGVLPTASTRKAAKDSSAQARTRSLGSTRYGPHNAPAAVDVTPGIDSARTRTLAPASARDTAQVSPMTPAPITTTS